jgi:hypothetical protein
MQVARKTGIDLDEALRRFCRAAPTWLGDVDLASPDGVARFLSEIRGKTQVGTLAERSGHSRFAVSRWLRGHAEPRLPEFLAVVDAASGRVAELAAVLADPALLPSVRGWSDTVAERMELGNRDPWTQVVLAALCLHTYADQPGHDDAWVAAQLGVDVATVARCLATLSAIGQIRWDGTHWEAVPIFEQDLVGDPDATRALKQHFARVGLERLPGKPGDLFSMNFVTASAADVEKLRELHLAYFRAVREVVLSSTDPLDRIVVINTQLFALSAAED